MPIATITDAPATAVTNALTGKIIVRFIRNQGLISSAICFFTGSSLFNHCEFGTPEGTWIGARYKDGIQERPPGYCKPNREYVYEIPCTLKDQNDALEWMRSFVGKTPYDFTDITGLLLHDRRMVGSLKERICSQFVILGLLRFFGASRVLNVLSSPEAAALITPETAHLAAILVGNLKKKVR